ncbi:MAG: YafY family protein [Pseudomonadota bacterium]
MRRSDRLFKIVQYLRGGRLTTAARLAERLEVSERTIYRDIADLQSTGVPIDGEAGVGYLLREGFDLPPLMFTREEIAALVAGARTIRAFGGAAMALAAEEALVKIEAVLPADARARAQTVAVHAMNWGMPDALRTRIDDLNAAIDGRIRLDIAYRDLEQVETRRIIRPLGLWFWGKVWTLVCWCELRNDFRMFRVDRIGGDWAQAGPFRPKPGRTLTDFYRHQRTCGGRD